MSEELQKTAPEFQEVLDGLHEGVDPDGGQMLDAHLARDSEIPAVYNGAALAAHRRNHDNAGAYVVIHANTHPTADVGRAMALSAPPDARLFRRGGPNFVAWFHDGPEAELFNQHLRVMVPNVVTGAGSSYERADAALRSGGGGDDLHTSFLGSAPEAGWKPGRESVKDARQRGLKHPIRGDAVQGIPGHDMLFFHTFGVAPQGYEHPEQTLEKAEVKAHPVLKHPIFSGRQFAILSGEHPRFPTKATGHDALRTLLQRRGIKHEEIQGFYDRPEKSIIAYDLPFEDARQLARDFGQESFIHGGAAGSAPILAYANGPHADTYHPSKGYNFWNKQPSNYWSKLGSPEQPLYFNLDVDWNQKLPLQQPKGAKSPHSYPWHDPHTMHHTFGETEDLSKAETNDQAAGVGVKTFAPTVAPWGEVKPGTQPSLRHYDFRPHEAAIDEMAAKHGYQFNFMGGKHGKPDLANKNFNTRHINIWDPSEGSGGDFGEEAYTRSWRKAHELAHALTYNDINTKYGEGRRIGKLGYHRTPHEAKRAIAWEDAAVAKQREIAGALGHHISDEDYNRERNNVIADATHRAIFGQFLEPGAEGFHPHAHEVPLQTAFDTVDRHAATMGLGSHDTLKTVAARQVQPNVA